MYCALYRYAVSFDSSNIFDMRSRFSDNNRPTPALLFYYLHGISLSILYFQSLCVFVPQQSDSLVDSIDVSQVVVFFFLILSIRPSLSFQKDYLIYIEIQYWKKDLLLLFSSLFSACLKHFCCGSSGPPILPILYLVKFL